VFHDRAKIFVEGGAGGNGVVSFRREAHVPRGGPDGGDGGRGGDVILRCDPSRRDLASMRVAHHYRAPKGGHGQGKNRHGARGEDLVVAVPPGTIIEGLEGARFDLVRSEQQAIVAAGGLGGHGNKRFTSATHQAPRFAERGLVGRSGWVELHLKLLADAGLIGLPNAGKSSLLGRITRAAPKVANYPFTTLEPVLGTIDDGERQLVLADIPGLIEGAAEGAGLGHEFLAHVERCRLLLHLLELGGGSEPETAYETVRGELAAHGAGLDRLPELVVLSKSDLLPEEGVNGALAEWRERVGAENVIALSSATGAGLELLNRELFARVDPAEEIDLDGGGAGFDADYRVYTPPAADGYSVVELDDGGFEVVGRGVEMLIDRHDLTNPEAAAYIERRLKEIGVIKALRDAGFEDGDEIRVGETSFDLNLG